MARVMIAADTIQDGEGGVVQIFFELDEPPPPVGTKDPFAWAETREEEEGKSTALARGAFEGGLHVVRACAEQVAGTMKKIGEETRPSTVEIEFGLKLIGAAGAYFVKTGAEGHLKVKLAWSRDG
jgi:Trypsin-co-occurring domain 1